MLDLVNDSAFAKGNGNLVQSSRLCPTLLFSLSGPEEGGVLGWVLNQVMGCDPPQVSVVDRTFKL